MNKDLKVFCEENLIEFLSHENIDGSCLGKGKLHPNKKGKAYLAKNFIKCINAFDWQAKDYCELMENLLRETIHLNEIELIEYVMYMRSIM